MTIIMNDQFLLGVVTGIATALALWFLRYFLGLILGAIAGLFVRSVAGSWKTNFKKENDSFQESVKIYQLFHWVWGSIVYPEKARNYKFKGTIRDNILVATYEVKGARSTVDRGAFTLTLNPAGDVRKFEGKYAWTDDDSKTPKANDYEWTKVK